MDTVENRCGPWNKGKLRGQKPPLKPREIWAIRIRLQLGSKLRDLALFNLAIDSKLRGCDLVAQRVHDVVQGSRVASRAIVMQKKTQRPVQFEITEQTRDAVSAWIAGARLKPDQFLFPSRVSASPHLTTRQYAGIVGCWVDSIGLDPAAYGTHSMRRTKPTLIYRRPRNLRAVQLLLGHTKLESTVRYLGIEVDNALGIAEQELHGPDRAQPEILYGDVLVGPPGYLNSPSGSRLGAGPVGGRGAADGVGGRRHRRARANPRALLIVANCFRALRARVGTWRRRYFTSSISPGLQVLSNHGSSAPYMRNTVFQPLPGTVWTQFDSLPGGGFGPK